MKDSAVRAGLRRISGMSGMGLLATGLICVGCSGSSPSTSLPTKDAGSTSPVVVAVTVEPINWLVLQIGGDAVRPITAVPPGQNHETWEPTPGDMENLRRASFYIESGMPFEEPLIDRLQGLNPSMRVVCLLDAVKPFSVASDVHSEEPADTGDVPDHSSDHGHDDHGHHHEHGDPHFWTDPQAMAAAAERIAEALEQRMPDWGPEIRARLASAQRMLAELDSELASMLASHRGRRYYVFHPETGWFAHRYGLIERAVELHGKAPGARTLDELAREIREAGVTVLLSQPGYSVTEVQALARQLNLEVREVNLMVPDYPEAMRELARTLKESFSPPV